MTEKRGTCHAPRPGDPQVAPCALNFALRVQAPHRLQECPNFGPENATQWFPGVTISGRHKPGSGILCEHTLGTVPSCENHRICVERAPIRKLQPVLCKAGNLAVVLEFNLSVYDQLARANVCVSCFYGSVTKKVGSDRTHRSRTRRPSTIRGNGLLCHLYRC